MLEFLTLDTLAALATLTILEIVLGIDNVIFISIVASRLPKGKRRYARRIGLAGALGIRILFLLSIVWIIGLREPAFDIFGMAFSWRDLILITGGLFLLGKGTLEIHAQIEARDGTPDLTNLIPGAAMLGVIVQIMLLDIVFSIDSILTAIGLTRVLWVMITAIVISIGIMLWAAEGVSKFIERHPTVKMLALAFLLLIGMALVADGFEVHIPRGYLYFAVSFSLFVEALNLAYRKRRQKMRKRARTGG